MNAQRIISKIGVAVLVALSAGMLEARQVTVPVDPNGTGPGTHRYRTRFMNPEEQDPLYVTHHVSSTYNTKSKEEVNPWGVELGVSYNSPVTGIMKGDQWGASPKLSGVGFDLTGVYNITKQHAITLRMEYDNGDKRVLWTDGEETYHLHTVALMPGYRFTCALSDSVSCFMGCNVGMSNTWLKYREVWEGEGTGSYKLHDSSQGFAYSAELGVRIALGEHVDVFVAYRFMGNTDRPRLRDGAELFRTNTQRYHSVRCGVGVTF